MGILCNKYSVLTNVFRLLACIVIFKPLIKDIYDFTYVNNIDINHVFAILKHEKISPGGQIA